MDVDIMVCNMRIKIDHSPNKYIRCYPMHCPRCGETLGVHGTYTRNVEPLDKPAPERYTFRVLECRPCMRTHREIPAWLIPYKRFSVEQYCFFLSEAEKDKAAGRAWCTPEAYRAMKMKKGFEKLKQDMIIDGIISLADLEQNHSLREETEMIIHRAVNNLSWKQQYFI